MLRLVKPEGTKLPKKGGPRHETTVLSPDEHRRMRQSLLNMRDAFGSWGCLAEAMGILKTTLMTLASKRGRISASVILRMMRASGLSLADLLGAPVPADRCRACGQIKRAS